MLCHRALCRLEFVLRGIPGSPLTDNSILDVRLKLKNFRNSSFGNMNLHLVFEHQPDCLFFKMLLNAARKGTRDKATVMTLREKHQEVAASLGSNFRIRKYISEEKD